MSRSRDTPEQLAGTDALDALVRLAQRCRLEHPTFGSFEAADFCWSSRLDQREEAWRCAVWRDDAGPSAAVVITRWRTSLVIEVVRSAAGPARDNTGPVVQRMLERVGAEPVEVGVRDDDPGAESFWTAMGFSPRDGAVVECWLDAEARVPPAPPPDGFELRTRQDLSGPHHFIARNGALVEARLHATPLYRADLDLAVLAPDGAVAAYALFWADAVTRVGLVEPVRTEEQFSGRGLASFLVRSGVERLAAAGSTRLKIVYEEGNEAARRAYVGAGFVPGVRVVTYVR